MLSLIPYSAQAQERYRLKKGEKAPIAGVILSNEALARLISEYDKKIALLQLQLEKQKRKLDSELKTNEAICKTMLDGEIAKQDSCKRDLARQAELLDKSTKRLTKKRSWYKSPYIHFLLGGVITGGVCLGASRVPR